MIARILQSIGACAGLVLGRAIVRDSAAPDRAAARLGLLTLVMSAAPAIAPVLGGYATAWMGWRAAFALLAIVGWVTLAFTMLLLPETNALQSGTRASLLVGSLRLFRSRAFCGYVLGGACTTTSFYAFMAASPFILVDLLHQPTERVGLYYLLLMAGVAAGGLSANRLAGRIRAQVALRIANSIAIAGAAGFMLVDLVRLAEFGDGDRADRGVHGRCRHGKPVRADRRRQRQPACDRRGIRAVRLHPDGLRRVVHGHRRGVAARLGVPRRGGSAGVRTTGTSGVVARGAPDLRMTSKSALQRARRRVPRPAEPKPGRRTPMANSARRFVRTAQVIMQVHDRGR